MGDADDDTVPTGRAGVDPLIAYPSEPTGLTGEISRPGDGTPWWFIPGMVVVALSFVSLWAYIGESRADDGEVTADVVADLDGRDAESSSNESNTAFDDGSAPDSPTAGGSTSTSPGSTTIDPLVAELPVPGVLRVADAQYVIASRCEGHFPFEPVDTDTQLSSYFFFDGNGQRGLIERTLTDEADTTTRLLSGVSTMSSDVTDVGDAGAFASVFVGGSVVVNPTDGGSQCADRMVTTPPGQLADPHTRIVLDVCVNVGGPTGTTIAGFTSEGSRFEILQAGGELAEIVFERGPDDRLRTSAPATIERTGDQLSASGVVSNGVDDLDITIDIGSVVSVADARQCTSADRL